MAYSKWHALSHRQQFFPFCCHIFLNHVILHSQSPQFAHTDHMPATSVLNRSAKCTHNIPVSPNSPRFSNTMTVRRAVLVMDEVHNDRPLSLSQTHTAQLFWILTFGVCKHISPHKPNTFQLHECKKDKNYVWNHAFACFRTTEFVRLSPVRHISLSCSSHMIFVGLVFCQHWQTSSAPANRERSGKVLSKLWTNIIPLALIKYLFSFIWS